MCSVGWIDVIIVVDANVADPENPDDDKDTFTISVVTKADVPKFGPPTPDGPIFKRTPDLRTFILKKCELIFFFFFFSGSCLHVCVCVFAVINGEAASLISPTFATKMTRTRMATLRNLIDSHKGS